MQTAYFKTFISAFAALPKQLRKLDGSLVICPPSADFGYSCTPKNALTFCSMGVDGVHYAILKIDGQVADDSPVVMVSPMDSDDVLVLAESLLEYLADGSEVSASEMHEIFVAEKLGERRLVEFLSKNFKVSRLLDDERLQSLTAEYRHLVY